MSDCIKHRIKEGLVDVACDDTFSGEETYLKEMCTGRFDGLYINFNLAEQQGSRRVLKAAAKQGMGVVAREAFMKGSLFEMAKEAGIENKTLLAHAAMKWVFSFDEVSTIVYGTGKAEHLYDSASILDDLKLSEEEQSLIEAIRKTELFKTYEAKKNEEFLQA